jgi:hypothetical protein
MNIKARSVEANPVMLSEAKHLWSSFEILRSAQNDNTVNVLSI